MSAVIENPFAVLVIALAVQWAAANLGDWLRKQIRPLKTNERSDFDTVAAAALTLLALLISFSFSMAVSRYDQRKNNEEAEANAIGTEYLRADLLAADDGTRVRELLRAYVGQRIKFYRGEGRGGEANAALAKLQSDLWSSVAHAGGAQPTPVIALAIAGMNDVINSQGFTQAAWLNRIPVAAWTLMLLIAMFANLLLGYRERSSGRLALVVLPVIVSIAFFLIADIDSPSGGVIRVVPHNLIATAHLIGARTE
jgi:hypothetical protein